MVLALQNRLSNFPANSMGDPAAHCIFTGQSALQSAYVFFGCDFEIPMIAVKGDITEDSRDIEIHCVLNEKNVVFVCG